MPLFLICYKPCLSLRHLLLAWIFYMIGSMNTEAGVSDVSIEPIDRTNFRLTIAGSQLEINIRDKILLSKQDILLEWIKYSAQAVHQYYGQFPVDRLKIKLNVAGGFTVRFGQAIYNPVVGSRPGAFVQISFPHWPGWSRAFSASPVHDLRVNAASPVD